MKYAHIFAAVMLASGLANAAPHDYQRQVGSSELDPSIWEGPGQPPAARPAMPFKSSIEFVYEWVDADGRKPLPFVGNIVPSGPMRISLYEAFRDSPEGTAYADYFERYPADVDWDLVQQQWQADRQKALSAL